MTNFYLSPEEIQQHLTTMTEGTRYLSAPIGQVWPDVLFYIKQLEREHHVMRSAIDIIVSGAMKDPRSGDMIVDNVEFGNLWKALSSLMLHP